MDYSKITLGELLSSNNETIKRNAIGILKTMQKANNVFMPGVNSGATCPHCLTDSVKYGIEGGSYIYYCLNCKTPLNRNELITH